MPDLPSTAAPSATPVRSAGAGEGASVLPVKVDAGGPLVPPSAANPISPPPVTAPTPPPEKPVARPSVSVASESQDQSGESEEDAELPPLSSAAVGFMTSDYYLASNERLVKEFNLTPDDMSFLNEMDHLVLGGALPIDGYVRGLRGEFPDLSPEQREKVIARLVAEHFLPWDTMLSPTAQEVARKEKLMLPGTTYYRVYVHPLTYGGAAADVARAADIAAAQGQAHERLRDLVMSRAKGIRVDAQVEEQLRRPTEMGGLGVTPEKAHAAVVAMNDIIHRAKLMTEDEYSAWLTEEARKKDAARQTPAPSTTSRGISTAETDEDAKEIQAIAKKMPMPVRDTSSVLALSTQTLLNRLSVKPTSDYLLRRLENLVSTRLRDVRSKSEVLAKLMREEKVGGVGLDRATAEKITAEIEEGYAEFHGLIAEEEQATLASQTEAHTRKVEERKKRDAEEHARWYQEKIRGKQLADDARKDVVERMKVIAQGFTNPIAAAPHPTDVKEQAKEKRELGELVPAPASSAPAAIPPLRVVPAVNATPIPTSSALSSSIEAPVRPPIAPPVIKVSAETAAAAAMQSAIRPRMDDVQVVRQRLEGPLQEIEGLTLASFRRLGKTPEDAIKRVEEKIELLGQESFEKRVQGIQAWQASQVQKAYLTLVAGAFGQGVPVNQLAQQKRAAGEDVPSPEEITAIVGLNGRLHF